MNRTPIAQFSIFLILLVVFLTASANGSTKESFDSVPPGELPMGWSFGTTGGGSPVWNVIEVASSPSKPKVLEQAGKAKYAWIVNTGNSIQDGFVEVKFNPIDGVQDQAGGVVWRFRDEDNYYVCRANALEDNVVLYKVEDGKRSSLQVKGRIFGYGVDTSVPRAKWSSLRVEFNGSLFTVRFNGKKLFQVEDETFGQAGQVGLWTKADSLTQFDDFMWGNNED